jgi:hypothetical protein
MGGWQAQSQAGEYGAGIKASVGETAALISKVDLKEILQELPSYLELGSKSQL